MANALDAWMKGARVVVVGGPSSNQPAARYDLKRVAEKFGVVVHSVSQSDFNRRRTLSSIKPSFDYVQFSLPAMEASLRHLSAIRSLIKEYQSNIVVGDCVDLEESQGAPLCLPMHLLRREGIIVGCEGDLVAALVQRLGLGLSEKAALFDVMDIKENLASLGHCAAPYKSKQAFCSKTRCMPRAVFPKGKATLVQVSAALPDVMLIREGEVTHSSIEGPDLEVWFKSKEPILPELNGNHVVMVDGLHAKLLMAYAKERNFRVV